MFKTKSKYLSKLLLIHNYNKYQKERFFYLYVRPDPTKSLETLLFGIKENFISPDFAFEVETDIFSLYLNNHLQFVYSTEKL